MARAKEATLCCPASVIAVVALYEEDILFFSLRWLNILQAQRV
jgi:hypothetical protein